jgi:hypothetical protein
VLKEFSLEEKKNRKVIYIDMRAGYISITYGFLSVINESNDKKLLSIAWEFFKKNWLSKVKITDQIDIDLSSILDIVKTEPSPREILKNLLEEMTQKLSSEVITLVVDEANMPLTINDVTSEADIKEVRASLALFTKLTKQEKKVSAIPNDYFIVFNNGISPFLL